MSLRCVAADSIYANNANRKFDAKMLVICMSVSWVVLEWYLSHDFIVGNRSLSSCKSVYYVLYKCCFLLFSQVTYQYTFVIWLIVR